MRKLTNLAAILTVLLLFACSQKSDVWVPGWKETSKLSVGKAGSAVVEHNGFIYMIAGVDGKKFLKTTEYAKVLADGSLAPWKPGPPLNIERGFVEAVIRNSNIYVVGGGNGPYGQNLLASAERASINPDGSLSQWVVEKNSMDTPRRCSKIAVWNDHIYSFGGYGGVMLDTVERAEIMKDGSLGKWVEEPKTMTVLRYINGVKAINGIAYVVGGHDEKRGVGITNVEMSQIIDEGGLNEWKNTSRLKKGRYALATAYHNDYLYAMGGLTGVDFISTVEKSKIKSNGELSDWKPTTDISIPSANFSVVVYKDTIYVLGGVDNDRYINNVSYAKFSPDGDIGYFGGEKELAAHKEKTRLVAEAKKALPPNEGVVKQVLQTSLYSYLQITSPKGDKWLAAPKIEVKNGDTIRYPNGVDMPNFWSTELGRNFPLVVFTGNVKKIGSAATAPQPKPQVTPQAKPQPRQKAQQSAPLWKKQTTPQKRPQAPRRQVRPQTRQRENMAVAKEILQTRLYTYIRVASGKGDVWLAAPRAKLKPGDKIRFPNGITMTNFTSKELKRTFPTVIFLDRVNKIQ